MFAHGFGCDQNMWRFVAPAFESDFRTVPFDHVGAEGSDLNAYDSSLEGYADDVVEIGRELELKDAQGDRDGKAAKAKARARKKASAQR
jgi:sigma-B regulation protein RsbQ